ncbi:MAG: phosphoribosyltransferase family protein [bacterium]
MKSFLDTILDVVFPVYCISCKEKGAFLCSRCLLNSPPAERESADWIFPLFDYRHIPIKKAIWFLKYKGKRNLAKIFAEAMYGRILEETSDLRMFENFVNPILIPIPLAPKRLRERGFNQATLICNELIDFDKSLNFKLEKNVLSKPKDGEHQARIKDRNKRLKNIIGCFIVKNPEIIKNRNIILIDDVTTTSATLNEARKILKQAGAKKIIAFTIAH